MSGFPPTPPTVASPLSSPSHNLVTSQVPGTFGRETALSWRQLFGNQAPFNQPVPIFDSVETASSPSPRCAFNFFLRQIYSFITRRLLARARCGDGGCGGWRARGLQIPDAFGISRRAGGAVPRDLGTLERHSSGLCVLKGGMDPCRAGLQPAGCTPLSQSPRQKFNLANYCTPCV